MRISARIDQLRIDSYLVGCALHTAFHHMGDA